MENDIGFIAVHADGTATATIEGVTKTFPDLVQAGEWIEKIRWEGKDDGGS